VPGLSLPNGVADLPHGKQGPALFSAVLGLGKAFSTL